MDEVLIEGSMSPIGITRMVNKNAIQFSGIVWLFLLTIRVVSIGEIDLFDQDFIQFGLTRRSSPRPCVLTIIPIWGYVTLVTLIAMHAYCRAVDLISTASQTPAVLEVDLAAQWPIFVVTHNLRLEQMNASSVMNRSTKTTIRINDRSETVRP